MSVYQFVRMLLSLFVLRVDCGISLYQFLNSVNHFTFHKRITHYNLFPQIMGCSGGAIMLGKLPVPGRPTI